MKDTTEVDADTDGVPRRILFAATTTLSNNPLPLLPHLVTFDDSDNDNDPSPDPPSADCGPLELELGPEVASTFEGFEIGDFAAATCFAASLSTFFKNGLGKFSSFAKSYSGEGWLLGTGVGSGLATVAAARLELLPDGFKCGCGSGFA